MITKKRKTEQLNYRIGKDIKDELKRLCEELNLIESNVIERLLQAWIRRNDGKTDN